MQTREIITRRNLPHWYVPGAVHFVTYRLAGTIPQAVLRKLRNERQRSIEANDSDLPDAGRTREMAHKRFFAQYDAHLDSHTDADHLSNPRIAALIRESLYYLNGDKYYLIAFSVMPSHVHAAFQPIDPHEIGDAECWHSDEIPDSKGPLSSIMHSLKSYTAHEANKILKRTGQFWQHESYDHWVRDDEELQRVVDYIATNPVKANLADAPHDYYFCSAHDRFLQDGRKLGMLLQKR